MARPARGKGIRGWLQTSFLERNQRLIGTIGVVAILLGTGVALLLSGGVFARTYPVEVHFADAGGIAEGDKVTVAGLEAGRVKGVEIRNGEVIMTLAVDRGVDLPADSSADVVIQTLLGKRVVSLGAGQDRQHTLAEVGVIPRDRTSTPIDITDLNDISVRLLNGSDADALNELLDEVTEITKGKRVEIANLVSGLADVTQAVEDRKTELAGLIEAFTTISTTLGERDDTLISLIDNLNPVLANLAERQEDLKRLLVATDAASHETADLVERNRPVLDRTLDSLHEDLNVLARHQLDLAGGISYLEDSLQGYASVAYSGGNCGQKPPPCERGIPNRWANIFVQSLGPAGVDSLLRDCGAVDRFFDQMFGTDCSNKNQFEEVKIPGAPKLPSFLNAGLNLNLPKLPVDVNLPALPCSVRDLVDSVLVAQPMRCLPG